MEIFKENKISKWKQIIKKLHNSKTVDQERLNTIENQLSKGNTLYNSDIKYLNELSNRIEKLENVELNKSLEDSHKQNIEGELQLIDQLHQKEIGDFFKTGINKKLPNGRTTIIV